MQAKQMYKPQSYHILTTQPNWPPLHEHEFFYRLTAEWNGVGLLMHEDPVCGVTERTHESRIGAPGGPTIIPRISIKGRSAEGMLPRGRGHPSLAGEATASGGDLPVVVHASRLSQTLWC